VVIFLVFYVFVFSPMPDWMIAFFYSGLGVALFLCGVRFLGVFARKEVLAPASERFRVDG